MDKKKDSKLYIFFDTLTRLAIINVLTLITSLGVVTLLPSLTAAINTMKDMDDGNDGSNLYKRYFINFKHNFKRSFFVGLVMTFAIAAFIYAVIYYSVILGAEDVSETNWELVSYIGLYFSVFILIVLSIVLNQLAMTIVYFNLRFLDNFKFAFFMSFRTLSKTLLISMVWIASYLLLVYLTGVWFFFGLGIPLFALYKLFKPLYDYIVNNKEEVKIEKGE
ncbi:MAG: DUF624 domain-containing protein [Bacilli bacterium]